MKHFVSMSVAIFAIIFACVHSEAVSSGCRVGLSVWYGSVVPVILPFMLLTGLITTSAYAEKPGRFGSLVLILAVGLMCGFPTGAMIISSFYRDGHISRNTAEVMLPLCNNVSPMFLYGFIYTEHLRSDISLIELIGLLYIPQLIFTVILFTISHIFCKSGADRHAFACPSTAKAQADSGASDIISRSIHSITVIGVYMVIFSVLGSLLTEIFPCSASYVISSFLEVSRGVVLLDGADFLDIKQKTALIISLTSFGGLSAIFQGYDMIKESELSFSKYICGKCICGAVCFAASALSL